MPTIPTLTWVVMVWGLMGAALVFVLVLAFTASRLGQRLRIDLDALFRIKVSINHEQSRNETRPTTPDDDSGSSTAGEKTSQS